MRSYKDNIIPFTEGIKQIWLSHKTGGEDFLANDEFKTQYKIPNCKRSLFDEVFTLTSVPTPEYCLELRKKISDFQKDAERIRREKRQMESQEQTNVINKEQECVNYLKSLGYKILKPSWEEM